MNYQELSSTAEFKRLHPVKQQIIKELMQGNKTISPNILLPKLMSINNELSKRNLNFTKEESTLLINILKENMTFAEQQKIDTLMNLFNH